MDTLSKTERQILEMRISGQSRKEIADKLSRSELTIKTHFQNIQRKSGTRDEIELVVWYLKKEKGVVLTVLIASAILLSSDLHELAKKVLTSVCSESLNLLHPALPLVCNEWLTESCL